MRARHAAVSQWVDDAFELGGPDALLQAPLLSSGTEKFRASVASGLSGTIFVGPSQVYFETRTPAGQKEWFALGALPDALGGQAPQVQVDPSNVGQEETLSTWVDDSFELGAPDQLQSAPLLAESLPKFSISPSSGLKGEVYLGANTVYFRSDDADGKQRWWDMGGIPPSLAAALSPAAA